MSSEAKVECIGNLGHNGEVSVAMVMLASLLGKEVQASVITARLQRSSSKCDIMSLMDARPMTRNDAIFESSQILLRTFPLVKRWELH